MKYKTLKKLPYAGLWLASVMGLCPLAASAADNEVPYKIIEGDILVPTSKATFSTSLWPGGTVPYEFDAWTVLW